jgi:sigma-B regulation protein RsbU (phosphoserine phosphatase)
LLLCVGAFSILYATRLLVQNELVRAVFNAPGQEYVRWDLSLTFLITIPYALFARELFGRGWKGAIAIWLWLDIGFAIVVIPFALAGHQLSWARLINGVLVVSGTLLILLHLLMRRNDRDSFAASLTWPLVIFGLLVLFQNRSVLLVQHRVPKLADLYIEPLGFLVLLAGLASTATRRALATERKLIDVEQELATARRIQSSIIPHSAPSLPSVHVATRYQPMTAVAGDFFDFAKTSEHCLTILVADVSGHGVPAALVASMLKVCFASQTKQANNPADILAGLNVMLRGSLGGQYVTAACAAIDTQARLITYAGAGHPPGLLLQKEARKVIQLAENGLFIGPFPNASYSNMSVAFQTGDKLLLYTDGIVEACGPDQQEFGRDRLEQFFIAAADQDPAEIIERLFRRISTTTQQDDLTVVLAHFH